MKNENIFDTIVEKVEEHSETMINVAFGISVAFSVMMFAIVIYELAK